MRPQLTRILGQGAAAYLVLAIGIALSLFAAHHTADHVDNEARLEFEGAVSDSPDAIAWRIRAYSDILLGIRGMYLAANSVSRAEFRSYVTSLDLDRRYPGVQVIHYAQRVAPDEREAFVDRIRNDRSVDPRGYPEFAIKPPGERPEYVVVQYVEPMAGNEAALGLDLRGDPVRLAALERTRDSGLLTASGIIALANDPRKYPGFAMRLPIYRQNMPTDTVSERRAAFAGVVSASFVAIDLMRGVFGEQFLQRIRVRIHDGGPLDAAGGPQAPSAANLIFDSDRLLPVELAEGDTPASAASRLARTARLEVGGRQWNLLFTARRGFVDPARKWLPPGALLGGMVISLLLFGLVRSLAAARGTATALANRITADLRRSEAHLAESQRMTEQLIEVLPNPIFFKDTEGRYIGVNRAWERYFGIPRAAFIGKTVFDLYPDNPDVAQRLDAMDQALWRSPGAQVYETSITTPDGRRDAIYYKATFSRPDGTVAGLIGTIVDITERKEAEARYRSTFESAPVGIMHTAIADGRILHANPKLCAMLGYSLEELLVLDTGRILARRGADRAKYREQMLRGELSSFSSEQTLVRKDGSSLLVNRTVSLARDAAGRPLYFIRIVEDITERKEAEELYRTTFDNAPVGIMHTALDDYRILRANRKLSEMLGYSQEELLGMTSTDVVHPDYRFSDRAKYLDPMRRDQMQSFSSERKFLRKDGSSLWVNRTVSLVRDAAGKPLYFIRVIEDISDRKQAEQRQAMEHAITRVLAEASALSEAIPRVIRTVCETMGWHCGARWHMDRQAGLLRCRETWGIDTPAIREFVAATRERVVAPEPVGQGLVRRTYAAGQPVWIADIAHDRAFLRGTLAARAGLHGAFAFPLLGGSEVLGVMEFFHRDVRDPDEMLIQIAESIGRQIGQYMVRMHAEEAVKFVATHDALTGLPNRVMFTERLSHVIAQAQRHGRRLAILFIDLDRFKIINDTLGHEAGDTVLREIARRLTESLRATDTVARLGGDEFVVLIEEVSDPLDLAGVAEKLIAAISASFALAGQEYHVTASIGVSTYPDDGENIQTLLKNADIAMYRAKDQGRNAFQFYSAQMNVHSVERLSLESGLRRALERGELLLHYQPQVDIRRGHVTGMEALARWQHPELGLIPPARFIPIAEETGLIVPIGEWVLRTACAARRQWQDLGLPALRIAINLSPRQFAYGNLAQDVTRVLEDTGCEAQALELEITESMVMHNPERAVELIKQLKALGVRVAIDDFGTGYSSLAYLKRFPIDSLKIDRSFIRDIPDDHDDVAITEAVIAMAHSLGLRVVAEGVETRAQFDFLRRRRCDEMQGYYVSAPLPSAEAIALLRQARASSA